MGVVVLLDTECSRCSDEEGQTARHTLTTSLRSIDRSIESKGTGKALSPRWWREGSLVLASCRCTVNQTDANCNYTQSAVVCCGL